MREHAVRTRELSGIQQEIVPMRFRHWHRPEPYADTSRKRAAFHRKQRLEREALPLFADQIASIQDVTGHVVTAFEVIADGLEQIDRISAEIATAVEQQGEATRDIARSAENAAARASGIVSGIASIGDAVDETRDAVAGIRVVSEAFTAGTDQLVEAVDGFLSHVSVRRG